MRYRSAPMSAQWREPKRDIVEHQCGKCGERLDYDRDELAEVGEVIATPVLNGRMPPIREIEYSVMHADCAIAEIRTNPNLELA